MRNEAAVLALAAILVAVPVRGETPEALLDRGLASAEIGDYGPARADLEKAKAALPAASPRRRDLHFGLGLVAYGFEEWAVAVTELGRAIELAPEVAEPWGWRALARFHRHEDALAKQDFAACFERDPKLRAVFETFAAEVVRNR